MLQSKQPMEVCSERKGVKPSVIWAAISASFGGLIFGYDIGGAGGTFTMDGFREEFDWPPNNSDDPTPLWVSNQMGWIMSTFALGAVVGATVVGATADYFGRRMTIQIFACIFTVGAVIQFFCNGLIALLYAGRVLGGIAVGGLSTVSPMYLSEIAPAYLRGGLIALQQLSITFGIFLASALNMGLQYWQMGWRFSYAGNGLFSITVFFLMFVCTGSPRWFVKVGREDKAREALSILRYDDEVDEELQDIMYDEKVSQMAHSTKWRDLFTEKRNMRFRTMVGVLTLGLQQFTGINVTFYFAPIIFSNFLDTPAALGCNLVLCFVNFFSTIFSLRLIDSIGRRKLMILGAMYMSFFSYGISIFTSDAVYGDGDGKTWIIVVFVLLNAAYVATFELSWGPVGWVLPAEIFPLELRGKAVSISTAANWLCNFLVGRMTPILIRPSVLDIYGTYIFFATWCLVLIYISLVCIPETKGIELEHMDKVFRDFRKNSFIKRLRSIELACSTASIDNSTHSVGGSNESSSHHESSHEA